MKQLLYFMLKRKFYLQLSSKYDFSNYGVLIFFFFQDCFLQQ